MSERHEPMLSATCRAEQHQDQPDDVTHICRWLSHAGPVHNCICGHSWEDSFEDRVMAGFTATCTCGTPGLDYEGPQADCMVHGAVRALNEVTVERDALKAAIADAFSCWPDPFGSWTAAQADAARTMKAYMLARLNAALAVPETTPDAPTGGED